jgi:hypothetical protein
MTTNNIFWARENAGQAGMIHVYAKSDTGEKIEVLTGLCSIDADNTFTVAGELLSGLPELQQKALQAISPASVTIPPAAIPEEKPAEAPKSRQTRRRRQTATPTPAPVAEPVAEIPAEEPVAEPVAEIPAWTVGKYQRCWCGPCGRHLLTLVHMPEVPAYEKVSKKTGKVSVLTQKYLCPDCAQKEYGITLEKIIEKCTDEDSKKFLHNWQDKPTREDKSTSRATSKVAANIDRLLTLYADGIISQSTLDTALAALK